MPVAIETLHPGVYVIETAGTPRVIGVSVNTAGFVGVAEKGPIYYTTLVTNQTQFHDRYGEYFRGSFLEPCIRYFFLQGGIRAFIARVVGAGAASAWTVLKDCAESGGPGKVLSVVGPFNLEVGEHLDVDVVGYATQVFTFTGTRATRAGNGFTGVGLNGLTLTIQFAGQDATTITFSGMPGTATVTDVVNFLNPLLRGGAAVVNGANVDFIADQIGNGSYVDITGGTALTVLGHTVFKTWGTGNVPNIDSVTAQDAAGALSTLDGAVASATAGGKLQIATRERGTAVGVQINVSTTALAFGFDNLPHPGWGDSGSAAQVINSRVQNYNLEAGQVLGVKANGGAAQLFTFTGTNAVLTGVAYTGVSLNTLTLQIQFSGYDAMTITFSGLANPAPVQTVIDFLNERIRGGSAEPAVVSFTTTTRTRLTGVATLDVGVPHGLVAGQLVEITGVGGVGYNGVYNITGTPTPSSFTYLDANPDEPLTPDTGGTVTANQIRFQADQRGSGSSITISGGTALAALGFVVGGSLGSGNVANIDQVTSAEVVTIVNGTAVDFVASSTSNGGLRLATIATGDTSTIQVDPITTTATNLGFDTAIHNGEDAAYLDSLQVQAENPGAWGNSLSIRTVTWSHTTVEEVFNGDTEIYVSSVRGVSIGDVIYTYDPTFPSKRYVGLVVSIAVNDKILTVVPIVDDLIGIVPAGSPIQSCSMHRQVTVSTEALTNGMDSLAVATASNVQMNSRITVSDGTTMTTVVITAIDGDVLRFAPVSLSVPIASGATVATQEFQLQVLEKGTVVETFQYLSMEENDLDYVGIRLNGDTNESTHITVTDLYAAPTDDWRKLPLPVMSQVLAYGQDGATPTDNDFIGQDFNPRTGMYLFDDVQDLNFFAIPGITTVTVQQEMIAYSENRANIMCILDAPRVDDQPTEVYNYRMFELNADTSYAALYWPWVIVRDPVVGNSRLALPPSGHIAGQYAATGATRGVHVAPANVIVRGAVDLTYRCSDAEQDILNPVGVNAIRWFPGNGIRIWGARTLFNVHDGRHYVNVRRLLNFVKESVKRGNLWAVFEPNDPRLWRQIEIVNSEFLYSLWLRGMLFPSTDVARAYFVKCDEETNPMSEIKEGRVNCEIGINPPLPAEFVIFRIGVWDGGSSVAEEIARRA